MKSLISILFLLFFSLSSLKAAEDKKSSTEKATPNAFAVQKDVGNITFLDMEGAEIKISGKSYKIADKLVVLDHLGGLIGRRALNTGLNIQFSTQEITLKDKSVIIVVDKIIIMSQLKEQALH